MSNIILVGDTYRCQEYILSYTRDHDISDFEREDFSETIKIADARHIKKTLSFMSSGQKMFVFSGEFTVEAQNALLKSIEEHKENIHFLFCSQNSEDFLPTIRSRCSIIVLEPNSTIDVSLSGLIEMASGDNYSWDSIEKLSETVADGGMDILIPAARERLLASIENKRELSQYHNVCKGLLKAIPLHKKNNISARLLLENVFGMGSTFVKTTS